MLAVGTSVGARLFARDALLRPYAVGEIVASNFHIGHTGYLAGATFAGSISGSAELANASVSHGFGTSGWDFIPIIASGRAAINAGNIRSQ